MSAFDPMSEEQEKLAGLKQAIRIAALAARREQADKDGCSHAITDAVMQLPAYQSAKCVMWYIDVRAEVRTRHALPAAIESGKQVIVPYCVEGELELFHLESMEELSEGAYRILEPREELRGVESKRVAVKDLDLVLVPGVGFDRRGGRIGHGKGYYDKLLGNVRSDSRLIALAFECQLFDTIPVQPHDVYMDMVVTEKQLYQGVGRSLRGSEIRSR
ncbi:5-formyltetrahydrofolate cyclo-ligase [Rhodopirellula islandica]|uniref:5-formyltetrahydrofolate cyclo-ligase n=1 Tax=Rhodopirellula islandica TaxID=595434 RepID=A0A0J1BKW6_RHOIS|nr:5-formyltetrahydrofolate cyclo-ligase [Rhodopirellula islandica]KLU07175.1 5-formyltetrahydrofolate cyclo-ligase [Rhodopirellula islandica]